MRVKQLDSNNSLIFQKNYPFLSKKKSDKPYVATLGIGGNIGDVKRRFNHLFYYLKASPFLDIVETSPILKNPPFGYSQQKDYHNALIIVNSCLRPKALLRYILATEKKFGRKRSFPNAPRTLDIDMIFYGQEKIDSKVLTIPHHGWRERTSVLIPLFYMQSKI